MQPLARLANRFGFEPACWRTFPAFTLMAILTIPCLASDGPATSADATADNASDTASTDAPTTFLDTITITATQNPNALKDTPGTVSVIDAQEIERELASDVRDLLRFEPGVYVESDVTRLGVSGFNIRGIGGNRVLTQVDGIATAEEFDFGPIAVSRQFLDLDSVKSVEIVRSAGSSLYGSDALGGVVSFVTKDPADYLAELPGSPYVGLKAAYDGRDNEFSETATAAGGGERWQASIMVNRRDGEELDNQGDLDLENSLRTTPNPQDRQATHLLGKVVYNARPENRLKLTVEALDSETETEVFSARTLQDFGPIFGPGSFFTIDTRDADSIDEASRRRVSVEQDFQGRGDGFFDLLHWQVYGQKNETEQNTTDVVVTSQGFGPVATVQRVERTGLVTFDQETLGGEVQAHKLLDAAGSAWGRHLLTWGVAYSRDDFDQIRDRRDLDLDTGNPDAYTGSLIFPTKYFPQSLVEETGIYLQDEIELGASGRLKLVPGLRFDSYQLDADQNDTIYLDGNAGGDLPVDVDESAVSPRLGVVYQLRQSLWLFGQYARGFRAPPFSSVNNGFTNLASGYTTLPNPDLVPETSDNLELGLRGSFRRGSFSLTAYENQYDDFIEIATLGFNPQTGLLEFQPRNVNEVEISGVELSGELILHRSWSLRGSYAHIDGDNVTLDVPLGSIPPDKLALGLRFRAPQGRWGAQLGATLVNSQDEVDDSVVDQFQAPSYEVFDLTAWLDVTNRLSLNLGLFNLTDETYWDWANVQGREQGSPTLDRYTSPGFNVATSVRFRF